MTERYTAAVRSEKIQQKRCTVSGRFFAVFCAILFALLPLPSCAAGRTKWEAPASAEEVRVSMKHIVHAAGALNGPDAWGNEWEYLGSNSMEGLEQCAEAGVRVIELDFCFTSDGELVCIHNWSPDYIKGVETDKPLSLDAFMRSKIYGCFTPVSLRTLVGFLEDHPDIRIVTDIKDDNLAGLAAIAGFCPDMKDRFIVQIYAENEYDPVRELGFDYVIFTLYRLSCNEKTDWKSLCKFAKTHPLVGYTFAYEFCSMEGYVDGMLRSGVSLFVHTVNEGEEVYFSMGISGIYTDYPVPPQD